MLHVNGVVIRLRKATRDRLKDSEQAIEQFGAEEGPLMFALTINE